MCPQIPVERSASLPSVAAAYVRIRAATLILQLRAATLGPLRNRRLTVVRDDERVEIPTNRGFSTGRLYCADLSSSPGAVLVHGSHAPGSGLPLYRLLGSRLAEAGITILAVDCLGFGQSRLPAGPARIDDYAAAETLSGALDYLRRYPTVDGNRVGFIGHSFGASLALRGARREPNVSFVIAIGPTRRVSQRYVQKNSRDIIWLRERLARRRGDGKKPTIQFVQQLLRDVAIEYSIDYWAGDKHPPVLLLDGSYEAPADLEDLQRLAGQVSEPKAHLTIHQADHYLNVGGIGPLVSYDKSATDQALNAMLAWIRGHAPDARQIDAADTADDR